MISNYYISLFKLTNRSLFVLIVGIVCMILSEQTLSKNTSEDFFYIGVERYKKPYVFSKEGDIQPQGILIDRLVKVCETLKLQCKFSVGEHNTLIQDLKTFKLHAVLILDSFIMPTIDKIKLTQPLCKIEPIFIQRKDELLRTKVEDFKRSIIGVQKGSLLHIYLLENYNNVAELKPYSQLENGIFDLATKRINTLFADKAFFLGQTVHNSLGRKGSKNQLIAVNVEKVKIPNTSMSLALRENDKERMDSINKVLNTLPSTPSCTSLLNIKPISDNSSENTQ